MNNTRLISDAEVRTAIKIPELIPVMDRVFSDLSAGKIKVLPRNALFHPNRNILAVMATSHPEEHICGCKVAMFPGPSAAATAQSVILLYDTDSGALRGIISADFITVARTAAATAAATDRLAREDAGVLCLLGAGEQAIAHAQTICTIRPIREIRIWSRTQQRLRQTCPRLEEICPACRIAACADVETAVAGADIVCTVSKAREPILYGQWLSPGCHVNAVGACGPGFRELDESVLKRAKIYVDSMDTAMTLAGDLLIPMKSGAFSREAILGEVGNCTGRAKGDRDTITLFESCGLGAQDVAAAVTVLERTQAGERFAF